MEFILNMDQWAWSTEAPEGAQKSLRSVEGNIFAGGFSADWLNIKKNGEQSFSVHFICTSVF